MSQCDALERARTSEGLTNGQGKAENRFEEGAQERSRSPEVSRPQADVDEEGDTATGQEDRTTAGEEGRAEITGRRPEASSPEAGTTSGTSGGS